MRAALLPSALVVLLCGSAQRAAAQDDWWGADKALHFGVSAGLAGGGYALAVPIVDPAWARATIGASFSLTLGIAKELYDWSGAGDASWRDFTWDVIGTATGVLVALGVEWLVRALSEPALTEPSPSIDRVDAEEHVAYGPTDTFVISRTYVPLAELL